MCEIYSVHYVLISPKNITQKQPSEVFCQKGVFKIFPIFTGKHLCNFIKKRLEHRCFSVNIVKSLRTPILKNFCERQLLIRKPLVLSGDIKGKRWPEMTIKDMHDIQDIQTCKNHTRSILTQSQNKRQQLMSQYSFLSCSPPGSHKRVSKRQRKKLYSNFSFHTSNHVKAHSLEVSDLRSETKRLWFQSSP